jgi:nucleoside-diphosphate-sugar epimerase
VSACTPLGLLVGAPEGSESTANACQPPGGVATLPFGHRAAHRTAHTVAFDRAVKAAMNRSAAPVALVLGANGRFGAAVVAAFCAKGWQVVAQARRPLPSLPAGARPLAAALGDLEAFARAAAGAAVVVHAINPPYPRWRAEVLPLGRQAMAIAERLRATFMLPGNVYHYGAAMPALLREDTPQRPTAEKGRIRCELEAELAARAERGLRSIVVRAGDFFGAGTGAWFDLVIVKSLRAGKVVYPGPLDVVHAWAYLPDLARAFVAVADRRAELPAVARLHFAGHAVTGAQFLDALERAAATLGLVPAGGLRRGGMPWALIRVGGWVVPLWRGLAEMSYLWTVPHALDGSALQRLLGEVPHTDLETALGESLQALGYGPAKPRA